MFYKIDSGLIVWVQWIVRQFELYTPIERMDLISSFLLLNKWMIILSFFLVALCLMSGYKFDMYFLSPLSLSCNYVFRKLTTSIQKEPTILPKEIISRYEFRCLYLLVFPAWMLSIVLGFLIYYLTNTIDTLSLTLVIIASIFVTELFLEYLLCTISLPPGEKQKRLEEKEMKNMIPIPLGH